MDGTCDVSVGDYDGDTADVFHQSIVTARKQHACNECRGTIEPRQQYERTAGLWDEGWSVWRVCLPCREISREFTDGARCFGILWEEMETNWTEGAHLQACLNRLTSVDAKARMHRQWLKWRQLDA